MSQSDIVIKIGGENSDFTSAWRQTESTAERGSKKIESLNSSLERSYGRVKGALASYLSFYTAREFLTIADNYTNLEAKLKLVTGSTEELRSAQALLYTSANDVRVAYESHVDLYARIARSMKSHNLSQQQTVSFAEAVSRSMIISGQTTQEASSFTVQFGQALASNRLQGEEFRAMLESNSRAVQVLTDYLHIDIGTLREWAKDGKITADVIYNAFSAASDKLKAEAELMPKTVEQALEHLKNAGKALIDETNRASGATSSMVSAVDELAAEIEGNKEALVETFADMATGAVNAAREVSNLAGPVGNIFSLSSDFLGLGTFEWGVIGFALLRGGPQAAALVGAIATINSGLEKFNLNIGAIGSSWSGYQEAFKNMADVVSGKRDWNTGEFIDQDQKRLEDLKKTAEDLRQTMGEGGSFLGSIFRGPVGELEHLQKQLQSTEAEIAVLEGFGYKFGDSMEEAGYNVGETVTVIKELDLSSSSAASTMGTLSGSNTKAATSSKAASAAAKEQSRSLQETLAGMKLYVDAAHESDKVTDKWIDSAHDASEAMKKLNEEYRTAGLDSYSAMMSDLDQKFLEGKDTIVEFNRKLEESNDRVKKAEEEYNNAKEAVDRYTEALERNSAKTGDRDKKDLEAVTRLLKDKKDKLDEVRAEQERLNAVNESGAMTEEQLREKIYNSKEALEKQRKEMIETARAGENFFDGMKAGFVAMSDDMTTFGELGFQTFGLIRDTWKESLYDVITGDFEGLSDLWDSMLKRMLKMFVDWIADVLFQWAMSELAQGLGIPISFSASGAGGAMMSLSGGSGAGSALGGAASAVATWINGNENVGPTAYTSMAGNGLSAAGGAYGLYNAYQQMQSGNAGVGTAVQAGISAWSLYKGLAGLYKAYETSQGIAAVKAGYAAYNAAGGGASVVGSTPVTIEAVAPSAAAEIGTGIVTTQTTTTGAATWGASEAAVTGSTGGGLAGGGGGAAGGAATGGLSTAGAMGGFAAFAAGLYLIQQGMNQHATETYISPTLGIPVNMRDYGHDQKYDVTMEGYRQMHGLSMMAGSYSETGGKLMYGESGSMGADASMMKANFDTFQNIARGVLDILANDFGDGLAQLALTLDGTAESADVLIDAAAGYDVALQESARLNDLARQAAMGNSEAFDELHDSLLKMGMSEDQAQTAMMGLIAASDQVAQSTRAASTQVGYMSASVDGMTTMVRDFNKNPLQIAIDFDTSNFVGGFDVKNPYQHAVGGIFTKPTLLHEVAEAGSAEAIIPLRSTTQMNEIQDAITSMQNQIANLSVTVKLIADDQSIARAFRVVADEHIVDRNRSGISPLKRAAY